VLLASACAQKQTDMMEGYGEADYIYLASQEAGVVSELSVHEGDSVQVGDPIFRLDPERLNLNAQSAASTRNALLEARRAAEATPPPRQTNYERSRQLFHRGFQSQARLDSDRAARDQAAAQLQEARR